MVRQNVFATTLLPTFERVVTPPRNRNSSLVRGTASMSMSTVQYRYNISCSARKSTNNPIRGLGETPIIPLGPPSVGFPRVFSASAGSSMDRSLYHENLRPFHRSRLHHLLNKYHILFYHELPVLWPRSPAILSKCSRPGRKL